MDSRLALHMPPNQPHSIQSQRAEATKYVRKGKESCNIGEDVPTGKSKSLEDSGSNR